MTKGFVAVATMSLVESGALSLDTRLRDLVGDELPLVDPAVTIENLQTHRSGVGDYLDEEQLGDIDDFIFDASVNTLATPDDYLPHISGHRQVSAPGQRRTRLRQERAHQRVSPARCRQCLCHCQGHVGVLGGALRRSTPKQRPGRGNG
jgi:CubicO group peptidase (beta-lactamase class C family)